MATYSSNSIPITALDVSGLPFEEAALIDGSKWGAGGYASGVDLSFSFPQFAAGSGYFTFGYGTDNETFNWFGLNANEQAAVVEALNGIAQGAGISFEQYDDSEAVVGELRFTGSDSISSYAHAYTPFNDTVESGDVWFSRDWRLAGGAPIVKGSYEYVTLVHEIGHALGLQHPFDEGYAGEVSLPDEYDNYLYTVMSYTAGPNMDETVYANFYPTTLMYLDLVALEKLYGPSDNANPGDTNYVYQANQTYWETITDSSGIDTITYVSSSHGGIIDLSNADFSHMGRPVRFDNGTATRDTIGLGPSTRIENATGGDGNDTLIGNYLANQLIGNGGNDILTGGAGADVLNGGTGADRLRGGNGNDTLLWQAADTRVDGGTGAGDALKLLSGNLDLAGISNARIINIEKINMTGGGNNTLTLNESDLLDLSSTTNTIRVLGTDLDTVNILGSQTETGVVGTFTRYAVGGGVLLIDSDITVT